MGCKHSQCGKRDQSVGCRDSQWDPDSVNRIWVPSVEYEYRRLEYWTNLMGRGKRWGVGGLDVEGRFLTLQITCSMAFGVLSIALHQDPPYGSEVLKQSLSCRLSFLGSSLGSQHHWRKNPIPLSLLPCDLLSITHFQIVSLWLILLEAFLLKRNTLKVLNTC